MSEAHVPTQQPPPGEESRVPAPHVDAGRPGHHLGAPAQGPRSPQRLSSTRVWRLRGRRNVETARRARRTGAGPIWVRYAPLSATTPPEIGYAVGRAVGGAVDRNLVRRRLRSIVSAAADELSSGRYLIGAGPGAVALTFLELTDAMRTALRSAGALDT